ncbi:MAG TPA: trypsin-like peptidase domain-containing protein [Nitrososphaerales archaeon]|nr:trypsin-like peptidase domain-containing protein [Nitrososphaerales archaeon]
MQTEPRSSSRGILLALVVVVLLATAAVGYYSYTRTSDSGTSAEISSLQLRLSNLQELNSALQSQLASKSSNAALPSMGPESLYANASRSVVTVQGDIVTTQNTLFGQTKSVAVVQGSGFVASFQSSYYVVTNNHVVDGATNITVTFSDGNAYPVSVKGSDLHSDLAVLSVNAPNSEFFPLPIVSSSQAVHVGESVYAIGSPFGLSGSMTFGIVSQVGRTITESTNTTRSIANVIQFSAPINPGNSGGPLIDSAGEVIGITTAAVSNSAGLGFAIPSSTIARELPSLVTSGKYALHPSLGIEGVGMTYQLAGAAGSSFTYGVLVEMVVSGSAADKAGIQGGTRTVTVEGSSYTLGGDIIVSIDGVKVVDFDSLASYLEGNAIAGQTVKMGIIRSGAMMTLSVTLGSLPSP